MDSRDIKEIPRILPDGTYLEEIFKMQKVLCDQYIKIENSIPYPLDINSKKGQSLIKDFTGRVIEELGEGMESFLEVIELTIKNRNWFDAYSESDLQSMANHLQNVGEEYADALHFMVELMIYSNVMPEDVKSYIEKHHDVQYLKKEYEYKTGAEGSILDTDIISLSISAYSQEIIPGGYIVNTVDTTITTTGLEGYKVGYVTDLDEVLYGASQEEGSTLKVGDIRLYKAGSKYSSYAVDLIVPLLWDVTYQLTLARNCLKNKPWKQSQMMTNETLYQSYIVKAFMSLMHLGYNWGLSSYDIYFLYFKKNKINQFRINSKY